LESKFEYTTLGLSYEHMQIIVGRIFKTRWRMWMLIYKDGMEFWAIV
jgi:hypothetical protein